jgi:transketolase
MLLYSLLHLFGYDLSLDDIKNFRQWESKTPGHPEFGETAGVETTTGPLGQGFANGVGMALAAKHLSARFNRLGFDVIDHTVYAIVSDGDLMEGVAQEAASFAGHLQLDNLIYLYDDNHITIDGPTEFSFSEDVLKRFEALGWHTQRVDDGDNDLDGMTSAIDTAKDQSKPALIAIKSTIGYGSPNRQNTSSAHGSPLGEEEIALTKQNLNWNFQEPFHVPSEVTDYYARLAKKGTESESQWCQLFEKYTEAHPDLAEEFQAAFSGHLPSDWKNSLPSFSSDDAPLATRKASGQTLNAIAQHVPLLIGGSADLAGSNNTTLQDIDFISANDFKGRNIHFGIREHGMGGILNGMALHGGVIPYGGTFLVFSDYMRASIRLAALMKQQVIYVFTHDSIGVGEDGPTHQPVEHLMALRTIPGLNLIRPADAAETVGAWEAALMRQDGPTALIFSRQSLPHLNRDHMDAGQGIMKGAYVLCETSGKTPDIILIATGSEVQWAVQAKEQLESQDIAVRVVSMPSWELFEAQSDAYREEVLPSEITKRLSIEAGVSLGWEKYVGLQGGMIALDRFGASAPGSLVMEKLGFNTQNVIQRAKALLELRKAD